MAYLLPAIALFILVAGTMLYFTRSGWLPGFQSASQSAGAAISSVADRIPGSGYIYSQLPTTFAGDVEAGLSSDTFDLAGNVADGDARAGLDDTAKREILTIMKHRRMPFDAARKVYMERRFRENGIGADGRPKDPKFVSFS